MELSRYLYVAHFQRRWIHCVYNCESDFIFLFFFFPKSRNHFLCINSKVVLFCLCGVQFLVNFIFFYIVHGIKWVYTTRRPGIEWYGYRKKYCKYKNTPNESFSNEWNCVKTIQPDCLDNLNIVSQRLLPVVNMCVMHFYKIRYEIHTHIVYIKMFTTDSTLR